MKFIATLVGLFIAAISFVVLLLVAGVIFHCTFWRLPATPLFIVAFFPVAIGILFSRLVLVRTGVRTSFFDPPWWNPKLPKTNLQSLAAVTRKTPEEYPQHPPQPNVTWPPTWRGSPFIPGQRYRARITTPSWGSFGGLVTGEILTFQSSYYSPYDSSSIYTFTNESGVKSTWWLHDDKPIDAWQSAFSTLD